MTRAVLLFFTEDSAICLRGQSVVVLTLQIQHCHNVLGQRGNSDTNLPSDSMLDRTCFSLRLAGRQADTDRYTIVLSDTGPKGKSDSSIRDDNGHT